MHSHFPPPPKQRGPCPPEPSREMEHLPLSTGPAVDRLDLLPAFLRVSPGGGPSCCFFFYLPSPRPPCKERDWPKGTCRAGRGGRVSDSQERKEGSWARPAQGRGSHALLSPLAGWPLLTIVLGVTNMLRKSMSTGRRAEGARISNRVFSIPRASWESICIWLKKKGQAKTQRNQPGLLRSAERKERDLGEKKRKKEPSCCTGSPQVTAATEPSNLGQPPYATPGQKAGVGCFSSQPVEHPQLLKGRGCSC